MLNIPVEIKTLLQADSVKKNFRVHFPNGEFVDLTNADIVSESVSFTESICSQSELKFGLCESPYIEFECVNIGNIKGATIECSIEIVCPSTVTGAVYRADIGEYVYPIPYGRFVVDECKKQADMSHRKIVAYSDLFETVNGRILAHPLVNGFYWSTNQLVVNTEGLFELITATEEDLNRGTYAMSSSVDMYSLGTYEGVDYMLRVRYNSVDADDFRQGTNKGVAFKFNVPDELKTQFEELKSRYSYLDWNLSRGYWNINMKMHGLNYQTSSTTYSEDNASPWWESHYRAKNPPNDIFLLPIAKYEGGSYFYEALNEIVCPYQFTVGSQDIYGFHEIYSTDNFEDSVYLQYKAVEVLHEGTPTIFDIIPGTSSKQVTLKSGSSTTKRSVYAYDFGNIFDSDLRDLMASYLELKGKFGRTNRFGKVEEVSINNNFVPPSGGTLNASNCLSIWYDDENIKPIGRIICSFKNDDETCETQYDIDGYSEETHRAYDLSDNLLISSRSYTESALHPVLVDFANSISEDITYSGADIEVQGMPDVECGDVIEVSSTESFKVLVANRTLKGVQGLIDDITSD